MTFGTCVLHSKNGLNGVGGGVNSEQGGTARYYADCPMGIPPLRGVFRQNSLFMRVLFLFFKILIYYVNELNLI